MPHFIRSIVVGIALIACGGGSLGAPGSSAPGDLTVIGTDGSTAVDPGVDPGASTPGRAAAPDFSLHLGDGSTFTLSEGAKPVYMVFWAEW